MSSKPIILTFAITPGTGTLSREIATGVNTYKISTIVDEFEKALFLKFHYLFPENIRIFAV